MTEPVQTEISIPYPLNLDKYIRTFEFQTQN